MSSADDRGSILLVDDDERFRAALARALERRGRTVAPVASGPEALERVSAADVRHAVVDLRLAEGSGLELVRELLERRPELEIVVLTAYASIATAVEAIKLGAVHYLAKPVEPDALLAAFGQRQGDPGVAPIPETPTIRRLEWEHIQRVLDECDGNVSAAARTLGIHRRSLQRKLAKRPVRR